MPGVLLFGGGFRLRRGGRATDLCGGLHRNAGRLRICGYQGRKSFGRRQYGSVCFLRHFRFCIQFFFRERSECGQHLRRCQRQCGRRHNAPSPFAERHERLGEFVADHLFRRKGRARGAIYAPRGRGRGDFERARAARSRFRKRKNHRQREQRARTENVHLRQRRPRRARRGGDECHLLYEQCVRRRRGGF